MLRNKSIALKEMGKDPGVKDLPSISQTLPNLRLNLGLTGVGRVKFGIRRR